MHCKRITTNKTHGPAPLLLSAVLALGLFPIVADASTTKTGCSLAATSDSGAVKRCTVTWYADSVRVAGEQRNHFGTFFGTQRVCFTGFNTSGDVVSRASFCSSAPTGHPLKTRLGHFERSFTGSVARVLERLYDPGGNLLVSRTLVRP